MPAKVKGHGIFKVDNQRRKIKGLLLVIVKIHIQKVNKQKNNISNT